ncbi:MAG: thioredoxin family protein [Solobacterium sp.]|nr:thioredoxin family protein [Solobacterium sp.]
MKDMTHKDNPAKIIAQSSLCVFLFGSKTCAPCAAIKRKIDEWMTDHPEAVSYYIDVEAFPEFSAQSGIYSVPSIRIFMDGIPVIEKSGYFSLEEIFQSISRLCDLKDRT